jgi:hypothetical protein
MTTILSGGCLALPNDVWYTLLRVWMLCPMLRISPMLTIVDGMRMSL